MRMARTPEGASLIQNPVSKAPGFQIGNVVVMAGIPKVMNAMMDELAPRLERGKPVTSQTVAVQGGEGDVAKPLKDIQERYPQVIIGSYPFESPQGFATNLVLRSRDDEALTAAVNDVQLMAAELTRSGKVRGWS
jgi:molybdopterin-biosynthesis enzyme MoeA-like protein